MLGLRTIPRANVSWFLHANGRVSYIDGPRRIFTLTARTQPLRRSSAEPHQFLVIRRKNGTTGHVPAPPWRGSIRSPTSKSRSRDATQIERQRSAHRLSQEHDGSCASCRARAGAIRSDAGGMGPPVQLARHRSEAKLPQGAERAPVHQAAGHSRPVVLQRRECPHGRRRVAGGQAHGLLRAVRHRDHARPDPRSHRRFHQCGERRRHRFCRRQRLRRVQGQDRTP